MVNLKNMKLGTLICLFSELENGRTLRECQTGIEKGFAPPGFMYMKSSSLKNNGILKLVTDPKCKRRKLIRLTSKGKKLKDLFEAMKTLV